MAWFLKQFIAVVKYSPKVVSTDTSAAIIRFIRNVFPKSFIDPDDWHLNQGQYISVIGALRKMKTSVNLEKWRGSSI